MFPLSLATGLSEAAQDQVGRARGAGSLQSRHTVLIVRARGGKKRPDG